MKDRILVFLRSENKSSAQLAEEIGVQPSGISHILSGRNNPSLDFILKMLEKYPYLSTEWLLFGKGTMYKDAQMQTLFNDAEPVSATAPEKQADSPPGKSVDLSKPEKQGKSQSDTDIEIRTGTSRVVRIVWFYADNSFSEYFPHI